MCESVVVSEMRDTVKWVCFNRPEVRNAVTFECADLMRAAIETAPKEGARVIVISGKGGAFCAGADLKTMAGDSGGAFDVKAQLEQHYHPLVLSMVESPLPVIAAVDGAAAGIGSDIALAADMRLVSEKAFFAEIFINIGLLPDGGGTFHLPRLVGLARALEMAMTGMRVQASQALEWGLVNHVYPVEDFEEKVQEFAGALAQKAPLSLERSKKAMRAALCDTGIAASLQREAVMQAELFQSKDFYEGVAAFLGKRTANFKGE
jgi:2-(1,2-epoxy-1,2-dihydrophenyl)acetyl-CoA isomerase